LYHAQPHSSVDILRNRVVPSLFVDVTDKIDLKEQMLRCHATQKEWLDVSQGMDSYLEAMREGCARVGEMAPRKVSYAEGFRQHMHAGFSAQDADRLSEVLRGQVQRGPDWW
jgi:LmbE family N-acetylglucosaminyl deacetylase